jgi:hypothetical protein
VNRREQKMILILRAHLPGMRETVDVDLIIARLALSTGNRRLSFHGTVAPFSRRRPCARIQVSSIGAANVEFNREPG